MDCRILQNGVKMPQEGFGVLQVRDKEECKQSVLTAIRAGHRLIDTAASYRGYGEDQRPGHGLPGHGGKAFRPGPCADVCDPENSRLKEKLSWNM